jgi:hypothetical protein
MILDFGLLIFDYRDNPQSKIQNPKCYEAAND